MKNNDEFKWVPCDQSSWNVDGRLAGAASAEDLLLLQCAAAFVFELSHRGTSVGVDELSITKAATALPVIQIG